MGVKQTCKLCRREGKKLFLKSERCYTTKCALVKRNYAPGAHGPKQGVSRRMSVFGRQLREKQSAKRIYNIKEKNLVRYFKKASKQTGNTEDNLYRLLETRLDNVVFRLGFANSRRQARQYVSHGHLQVNDKKVDIASFSVRVNDVITIKSKSKEMAIFKNLSEKLKDREMPDWLFLDSNQLSGKVVDLPQLGKAAIDFDMKQIIEFYSR